MTAFNEIVIAANGDRTITGEDAHTLAFSKTWPETLAQVLPGRFCVFDADATLVASQTTVRGAYSYLAPERTLVYHN